MKLEIHVYRVSGEHETFKSKNLEAAKQFADEQFKRPSVYKVKVWKGTAVPNIVDHPNLVYHLV